MVYTIEGGGGSKPKPKKKFKDTTRVKTQAMEKESMPALKKARNKMRTPDMIDLNNELRGRGDQHALEQISFHESQKNKQPTLYRQVLNNYKALDEKLGGVLPGGGHMKEYARSLVKLVSGGGDPQNPIPEEPLIQTWDDRNVRNNNTKLNPISTIYSGYPTGKDKNR